MHSSVAKRGSLPLRAEKPHALKTKSSLHLYKLNILVYIWLMLSYPNVDFVDKWQWTGAQLGLKK